MNKIGFNRLKDKSFSALGIASTLLGLIILVFFISLYLGASLQLAALSYSLSGLGIVCYMYAIKKILEFKWPTSIKAENKIYER